MTVVEHPDAHLVSASRAGDRNAFGQIVGRYQSLVCSVAYSSMGSLSLSEDVAQETFIVAWKKLSELREPEKLRAWLCGIARNVTRNTLRKLGREPVQSVETLEDAHEIPALEKPPGEQAMSREEEAILWRSLERIPENYREPLVLFYREGQSIEQTATLLDLSEDAVKQRLSRGRKLLAEEVTAFVEGALKQSTPGRAFTLGVLAALPGSMATSAKAASVAVAAAKTGATATGATFGAVLSALCGPLLGIFCGYLGMRESLKQTRTSRERAFVLSQGRIVIVAVIAFVVALLVFGMFQRQLWAHHPVVYLAIGIGITLAYAVFIFVNTWRWNREYAEIRDEERKLHPEAYGSDTLPAAFEYRSQTTLFGVPLVHVCWGIKPGEKSKTAFGWLAFGGKAYGLLYASGGLAIAPVTTGGCAIGLLSFGGVGIGLLTFGGLAFGGIAEGGVAIGLIASGGFALAWHAAIGGVAAAYHLALGGAVLAPHGNDPVAREFFTRYHWLDISNPKACAAFWLMCFGPMAMQFAVWGLFRKKLASLVRQKRV